MVGKKNALTLFICACIALSGCTNQVNSSLSSPTGSSSETSFAVATSSMSSILRSFLVTSISSSIAPSTSSSVVTSNFNVSSEIIKTFAPLDLQLLMAIEDEKTSWGSGYGKNGGQPSIYASTLVLFKKYNAWCFGSKESNKIYLTFDEGYENGYTSSILDTLKEKNAKAVFFVTKPYVDSNLELVARMIVEGHIVGNHSCKHQSFPTISVEQMQSEIKGLHLLVREKFGYEMQLFRYPMGEYSERSLAVVNEMGYTTLFWSFAYLDYDVNNQKGADYAYDMATKYAHNGAIYLLHAVSQDNAVALGRIIDTLRNKGYELSLFDLKY